VRFHRVDVVAAEPAPTAPGLAVVITAQGPRVEGLDVERVARPSDRPITLTVSELDLFLDGSTLVGSSSPSAGTVWGVHAPTVSFYRILPGKSADEGLQVLGGYRGTVVVDGFAVYEVLARDGPGLVLAHCWAHTKRKYDDIADQWSIACAEIRALIGELYAIERLVPGPFPGDASAQTLRQQLRKERSRPILGRIWQWATVQVGLPRSDFGKAVRYMLERWAGLTRFVEDPRIPLDNNAAERALRGPVVGRKNHYGSRSLRGTEVAAAFYTLCETARLVGVDPRAYLLRAVYAAIGQPGTVTFPEDLLASTRTA
jgi:transposase